MKKTNMFLSILIFAALLLAACGAEETNVPGTDVPSVTAEVTATEDMATESPTESPTEDGTMTETPGVPVTGDTINPARLSSQLDFDVWNQNGEQIGEVNDMVVDLDNSTISYVIVGTGGFLEIGEKDVFVPWESLQLQTGAGDMTGGEENAFILQEDQELFNNAQDVDVNDILPERGAPANDWDVDIRNYWETGELPATVAPDATTDPAMTATMSPEATAMPDDAAMQGAELQGAILATELLDSDIMIRAQTDDTLSGQDNGEGTTDATAMPDTTATTATDGTGVQDTQVDENVNAAIDDVIVDPGTGEVRYLVIDATFGDTEHFIPVPLNFLQWSVSDGIFDDGTFIVNTDSTTLQDAPSFPDDQYPDMTVEGWDSDFDAYWQNIEPTMPAEMAP